MADGSGDEAGSGVAEPVDAGGVAEPGEADARTVEGDGVAEGPDGVALGLDVDVDDGAAAGIAPTGAASTSDVRRKSGDPRYQPTGRATTRNMARIVPVRRGCRRAAAIQPRCRATIARPTNATRDAIATGTRAS